MDSKKWLFVFAACSGIGGLAGFLYWLGIKPSDLWGWQVSLAIPHWLLLVGALLLFVVSIGLSVYGLYYKTAPPQSGGPWKPAWQKLQWCNAERERLQGEVSKLQGEVSKWKDMYTSATSVEEPSLAERVSELATKYKRAAREFLRQNPQPPAPPASTAWTAKARAWQSINFHSELKRAMDELVAAGLTDPLLQLDLEAPPTLAQVESTTRLLRFMAAQLDDDSGDYQNVRLPVPPPIIHFVFVNVSSLKVDEKTVSRGKTLKIRYEILSSEDVSDNIWLGASFPDPKRGKPVYNPSEDKRISLLKGTHAYDRNLTIPADASLGSHMLGAGVWQGVLGDSSKSVAIAKGTPVEIVVVA